MSTKVKVGQVWGTRLDTADYQGKVIGFYGKCYAVLRSSHQKQMMMALHMDSGLPYDGWTLVKDVEGEDV